MTAANGTLSLQTDLLIYLQLAVVAQVRSAFISPSSVLPPLASRVAAESLVSVRGLSRCTRRTFLLAPGRSFAVAALRQMKGRLGEVCGMQRAAACVFHPALGFIQDCLLSSLAFFFPCRLIC